MKVAEKTVVSIHYTLKGDGGEVIDTSDGGEPLKFLYGVGMIIPGLETELAGMSTGEKFKVSVAPEQGYGQPREDLVQTVPRQELQHIQDLQEGANLQAQTDQGDVINFVVTSITLEQVTLDANHPLAGQNLHFEGEVVEIREATEEELSHGHNH